MYSYTATGQKQLVEYYSDPMMTAQPISGTSFTEADINNLSLDKIMHYEGALLGENWTPKKILIDNRATASK